MCVCVVVVVVEGMQPHDMASSNKDPPHANPSKHASKHWHYVTVPLIAATRGDRRNDGPKSADFFKPISVNPDQSSS